MNKLQIIQAMSMFSKIEEMKTLINDAETEIDRLKIQGAKVVQLTWENTYSNNGHVNLSGDFAQPLFESVILLLRAKIGDLYDDLKELGVTLEE